MRGALAAALAALAGPALAATEPPACSTGKDADARVRCAVSTHDGVIIVKAARGGAALIELHEGERVVGVPVSDDAIMRGPRPASSRYASADDGAADGLPDDQSQTSDGNLSVAVRGPTVVVKPHRDLVAQPFFVLTERDGRQTRHRFELQTVPAAEAYYSVRVRNLAAEGAERQARLQAAAARREGAAARERLAQANAAPCAAQPGVNTDYIGQGDRALAPEQVCDNGRQTFLRFPGSRRVPSVFTTLPDGKEAAVNDTPNPDGWIVVHGRSPRLVLRDAGRVLCVVNRRFDEVGRATGTGTAAPDVVREVKE